MMIDRQLWDCGKVRPLVQVHWPHHALWEIFIMTVCIWKWIVSTNTLSTQPWAGKDISLSVKS